MLRLLAIGLLILFSAIQGVNAEVLVRHVSPSPPPAKPSPSISTVGVLGGGLDSAGLRMTSDLAQVLDHGNELRIIPMAGKGSLQSLNDLLSLREVDIAIVPSDVLARFAKTSPPPALQSRVQYLAKLNSDEFHVLSRMQFLCLQDLTGRRVSFGPRDSGMLVTAEAVFEAAGVAVTPLYLDHDEAVEALKRGELDALVYVGGKPSRAFDKITHKDKVHFLDVEYLPALQPNYLPSLITSEDYPELIAPNESVGTIAVSTVMVMQSLPPQSERFRILARFSENFFANIDKFTAPGFSPKWREVDIRAPLKGWQRFPPAEKWLAGNTEPPVAPAVAPVRRKFKPRKLVKSQRGGSPKQDDLLNRFVRWRQQQNKPQP